MRSEERRVGKERRCSGAPMLEVLQRSVTRVVEVAIETVADSSSVTLLVALPLGAVVAAVLLKFSVLPAQPSKVASTSESSVAVTTMLAVAPSPSPAENRAAVDE